MRLTEYFVAPSTKICAPSMKKVSVSIDESHDELLEERQDAGDATSRSDALRRILDEYEDLRTRLESREERVAELEEQLRRRSQVEEKVDVLAKRVDEPEPPFWVRWKQWFTRDRERDDS